MCPIPNASPLAMGVLIDNPLITEGPTIPPTIPVIITKTVVNVGSPPISFETSIAIGVVIDRGNMEMIKSEFKWNNLDKP